MPTPLVSPVPAAPGQRYEPSSNVLEVIPLPDPVVERVGFDPRAPYVERYWLAVLGPTSFLLLRHLAAHFDVHPDGFSLDRVRTAHELGVGGRSGRNSPFVRALARCGQFGLIQRPGSNMLSVRRCVPPLTRAQILNLPGHLQRSHQRWQDAQLARPQPTDDTLRARQVAVALFEVGEEPASVRGHLEHGRFRPDVAANAVQWAIQQARVVPPNDAA